MHRAGPSINRGGARARGAVDSGPGTIKLRLRGAGSHSLVYRRPAPAPLASGGGQDRGTKGMAS